MAEVDISEITAVELDPEKFIEEKVAEIREIVGEGYAINALSGGVDSSVVTMLAHRALGDHLRTVFVDNGLMRQDEPQQIVAIFENLGVPVEIIDAQDRFIYALSGVTEPEPKRNVIVQEFYPGVFAELIRNSRATFVFQGTNFLDIQETVVSKLKRQHNVFAQLGIDPQKAFGYQIIEPLIQLRKDGIRLVARALGLPEKICSRIPFPGPALAARIIGEVTKEKIALIRQATAIVETFFKDLERELDSRVFQYLAILHNDRVTGIRDGKREFGYQIEVRCWDSTDASIAWPTWINPNSLFQLASQIVEKIPEVVSVTYNITNKPSSTIEAI